MRFIVFILGVILSFPATAQESEKMIYAPGSIYKNEGADYIRALKKKSLAENNFIKPSTIQVSLVRYDFMDQDQFGILMAVPEVVSGCWKFSPLQYEASFIDTHYLDIKVGDYQRKPVETQNVASGCPAGNKMSTALVVMSRADLQKREILQIRFTNGSVADYYDIMWGDKDLSLKPQSMVVFKAKNLEGPMKDHINFGFDGGGRVALRVPMAKKGDDLQGAMMKLASQKALTPAPENTMSYDASGSPVFYFNDVSGRVLSQIGEDGFADIGTVTVARPFDGPAGRQMTGVPLRVYAIKPGADL